MRNATDLARMRSRSWPRTSCIASRLLSRPAAPFSPIIASSSSCFMPSSPSYMPYHVRVSSKVRYRHISGQGAAGQSTELVADSFWLDFSSILLVMSSGRHPVPTGVLAHTCCSPSHALACGSQLITMYACMMDIDIIITMDTITQIRRRMTVCKAKLCSPVHFVIRSLRSCRNDT